MADLSAMADSEFWALCRDLLAHGSVSELADYVHDEAERRDPELARLRQERRAIYAAALARTPEGADPFDAPEPLDGDEDARAAALWDAYVTRFTALATTPDGKEQG